MSDYDYLISVDENGQPYLEHALFGNKKGSTKQNHKYYARAEDKGRWRYFYSPEEFRAWASGGIRKAKQAANDAKKAAGNAASEVRKSVNARRELNEANKQTGFGSGLKQWNAQRKYNKTAMGKAEKAVKNAANDLGDRARGAAATAEGRARQLYDETRNAAGKKATELAGKAGKKIKSLTDAAEKYGNKTLSELRDAADSARGKASEAAGRARKAAEDKSGVTDQKARDEARRRAMMGLDDAVGDYADSDNRYQKSAKGKADKAVAGAKNAAGKARDTAEEAGDRVKDAASRARDAAENLKGRATSAAGNAREKAEAAADTVANKAADIRDRIRDLADSAGSRVRETADRARDAANNAASSAREAASNAASRAQNAAGEVTGGNAKKEMDAAGRRAMMGLDDAIGSYVDAQTRYDNSIGGKVASARSNAEASLKSAQSAAKKALAKAMDYLPDEQIEAIKDLIRGK